MAAETKDLTTLIAETKQEIENLKQRLKSLQHAPQTRQATEDAMELLEAFVYDLQQAPVQRIDL